MITELLMVPTNIYNCPYCDSVLETNCASLVVTVDNAPYTINESFSYCKDCHKHYCTSEQIDIIRDRVNKQMSPRRIKIPSRDIETSTRHLFQCPINKTYCPFRQSELSRCMVPAHSNFDACISKVYNQMLDYKSAYCIITLRSKSELRAYIIVTDYREANPSKYVLNYLCDAALKLLSAVLLRRKDVYLNDELFTIQGYTLNKNRNIVRIIMPDDAVEIVTKKNGGYFDPDDDTKLFAALVLCSDKEQFKALEVSYSKSQDTYYVDSRKFHNFCEENGLLLGRYVSRKWNDLDQLREQSLLNSLGYNVSATHGLSLNERRRLLERIVDSDMMKVHQIVDLLDHLIKLNGKQERNANAVEEWRGDLEHISNYKVNPDRFVVVKEIRGKARFFK